MQVCVSACDSHRFLIKAFMDNKITNEEVFIVLANNLDFLTLFDGFIEHCKLQFDYGTEITSWYRATRTSFQKIRTVLGNWRPVIKTALDYSFSILLDDFEAWILTKILVRD